MTASRAVPERRLARAWRRLALPELTGPSGGPVRVVFPGAPNPGPGPDFTGAVVAGAGGELVTGDIEIDLSRGFWKGHGHDANPSYRGVVFQVVPRRPGAGSALPGGRAPPVLEAGLPSPEAPALFPERKPCPAAARGDPAAIPRLVGWAGELRFRAKADGFCRAMGRTPPAQVLYEGLMESLGYSLNQLPFRRLARALPLHRLHPLACRHPAPSLEALLLGSAGLLPSQRVEQSQQSSRRAVKQSAVSNRQSAVEQSQQSAVKQSAVDSRQSAVGSVGGESVILNLESGIPPGGIWNLESGIWNPSPHPFIDELEREWAAWRRRPALRRADWRFFKVRPANTPPRRLAAAAYLLDRVWRPDPAAALLPLLHTAAGIEKSLAVPAGDYWRDHLDFGVPAPLSPGLLGLDRRRDMMVNIVLPFFYALGNLRGERRLRSRSLELYADCPPGGDNLFLRTMRERLPGLAPEPRARQQQGLLHLYHRYCRLGRCGYCPLIRARATGL
ncbi:MAG: DUF2851 family protein [Chloroflexi bacterium]|nr:DUF2851 family protein [Chloroflexota bacterium]